MLSPGFFRRLLSFCIVSLPLSSFALGSFDIVISAGANLAANSAALAAFERSAQQWESRFADPITITINADLAPITDPTVIGSASNVTLGGSYSEIRDQMVVDSADEADDSIVAFLPTSANVIFTTPATATFSGNLSLSKANAKALGFGGLDTSFGVSDGSITFNSNFNFDYDRSDGVTQSQIDFQTVATHEIGHVLGFISSVDAADSGAVSLSPTTLDLFRFNLNDQPITPADFTLKARELRPGQEAVFTDLLNDYRLSTGSSMGDGRQASHFKDDSLLGGSAIGVMDPTLASGTAQDPTEADYRVFDLAGYESVPEPGVVSLLGAGAFMIGLRRFRKRT